MVMRNRHEGGGTPQWWDDLPPSVRSRFTHARTDEDTPERPAPPAATEPQPPLVSRSELLVDLSRFAVLFLLASIVILLYLLIALSYVAG